MADPSRIYFGRTPERRPQVKISFGPLVPEIARRNGRRLPMKQEQEPLFYHGICVFQGGRIFTMRSRSTDPESPVV